MLRIVSLNLNGIRSAASKGAFEWLDGNGADIVCVQEIKAQQADIDAMREAPARFSWAAFHCADKKGYSGVGLYARRKPDAVVEGFGDREFDAEGRYLQADFGTLSVVSLYLPSGSSSEERQQAKFRCMEKIRPRLALLAASGRDVVICGDWNIAHTEKDLKNWKSNQKNSGFLPEERAWLGDLLAHGWVDVHRTLRPEDTGDAYTWWSNRGQAWAKNVGWRIDYQIATPGLAAKARAVSVYKAQRFSDHAPLIVDYSLAWPRKTASPRA